MSISHHKDGFGEQYGSESLELLATPVRANEEVNLEGLLVSS